MSDLRCVLDEVLAERAKQDAIFGGPEHDDHHSLEDWCEFIRDRTYAVGQSTEVWVSRSKLLAIAALAVAAIQSIDRKTTRPPDPARAEGKE